MTQELYAIHDNKASFFMTPWPCRNVGIARREFASACANPETAMGKFPADFVLYHVGEYDDHDASVKSSPAGPHLRRRGDPSDGEGGKVNTPRKKTWLINCTEEEDCTKQSLRTSAT